VCDKSKELYNCSHCYLCLRKYNANNDYYTYDEIIDD
jgi:hypothetical protein